MEGPSARAGAPVDQRVTDLLRAARAGDRVAFDELIPLVYDVLRRIAHRKLAGERASHTLSTTDLVHEAYLKLVRLDRIEWQGRAHFLAIAAQSMRNILVDYALQRKAEKRGRRPRGGGRRWKTLAVAEAPTSDLLALHEAMRTAGEDRRAAEPRRGVPLLRRHEHRGDRGGARGLAGLGEARLGLGARLAQPRAGALGGAWTRDRWRAGLLPVRRGPRARAGGARRAPGRNRRPRPPPRGRVPPRGARGGRAPRPPGRADGHPPGRRAGHGAGPAGAAGRSGNARPASSRAAASAATRSAPGWAPEAWARCTARSTHACSGRWPSRSSADGAGSGPTPSTASRRRPARPPLSTTRTSSPCTTSARRRRAPYIVMELRGGREPAPDARRPLARGAAAAPGRADRRGAGGRPRAEDRPPRPQAREHPGDARRDGEDPGLRPRPVPDGRGLRRARRPVGPAGPPRPLLGTLGYLAPELVSGEPGDHALGPVLPGRHPLRDGRRGRPPSPAARPWRPWPTPCGTSPAPSSEHRRPDLPAAFLRAVTRCLRKAAERAVCLDPRPARRDPRGAPGPGPHRLPRARAAGGSRCPRSARA